MSRQETVKIWGSDWDRMMSDERFFVTVLPEGPGADHYQYRLLIFNPDTGEERHLGEPFQPHRPFPPDPFQMDPPQVGAGTHEVGDGGEP